ncbi:glycosyl transferase [Thozetella sp. PMI_491]|nr:glycosyl transferase [Thozetella sp. PMI_491]
MHIFHTLQPQKARNVFLFSIFLTVAGAIWYWRSVLYTTGTLLALPFVWSRISSQYMLPIDLEDLHTTLDNYTTAQPLYTETPDHEYIPAILHHIGLYRNGPSDALQMEWQQAKESCLDLHPGWESHLWTDEKADAFIAERFPDFKDTWQSYRYPIQKADALRYFVLYEFGGVYLDLDLICRQSVSPLRRFRFVAPAAYIAGFSNGFMMSSKGNSFLRLVIDNLKTYNRAWFWLPYSTVMFSTGGWFASTVLALNGSQTDLKILTGPPENPNMHRIYGAVSTPLFHHLGSSSWHSYDAGIIVAIGKLSLKLLAPTTPSFAMEA